jgi:hypothetical protein
MSAKVDPFCDRLRDRLNAIERWLETVKADIQTLPWKVRKAHQARLRDARAKLQAQKEHVERTRAELKSAPRSATELLVDAVIGWKPPPSTPGPTPSPDRAEAHVTATIDHAEASIDEVRDAALCAAAARLHDVAKEPGACADAV